MILLTQSRGAFVALVATVCIGVMITRRRGRALGTLLVLTVLSVPFVPDSAWQRFGNLKNVSTERGMVGVDEEGSAQQRYQTLQVALRVAQEHPITGIGPMMYAEVGPIYGRAMATQYPLARNVRDPHNTFLRLSTELGIPGLLLFVAMMTTVLTRAWRQSTVLLNRGEPAGQVFRLMMLGLFAYLLAGLFSSIPYINVLYMMIALLGSLSVLASNHLDVAPAAAAQQASVRRSPALRLAGVRGGLANVATR
jgi:O-antigen ligase